MKKIIFSTGFVIVLTLSYFTYQHFFKSTPLELKGEAQTLENKGANNKNIPILKTGYYDISTIEGNSQNLFSRIPPVNEKMVGQYFEEGEEVTLQPGEKVLLEPAQFEKLPIENKKVTISTSGSYLVGTQIPSGSYTLSLGKELDKMSSKSGKKVEGELQIVLYNPNDVHDSEGIVLTNKNSKKSFDLQNGKLLAIKNGDLKFELNLFAD